MVICLPEPANHTSDLGLELMHSSARKCDSRDLSISRTEKRYMETKASAQMVIRREAGNPPQIGRMELCIITSLGYPA